MGAIPNCACKWSTSEVAAATKVAEALEVAEVAVVVEVAEVAEVAEVVEAAKMAEGRGADYNADAVSSGLIETPKPLGRHGSK